ncbi:MAG: hypothetical protein AB8G11_14360 [Saprospiraceae bacterium]
MYHKIDKLFGKTSRYYASQSLSELQQILSTILKELDAIKVPQKYLKLKITKIEACVYLQDKLAISPSKYEAFLISSELLEKLTETYIWLFNINEK